MKECRSCLDLKEESEFYITSKFADGKYRDSVCKKCRNIMRYQKKPTKEEKIKKWCERLEKVWNMGEWLKSKK